MSKVVISGIGVVSALGTDVNTVWNNINNNITNKTEEEIIQFEPVLKKNKLRRINRYSHLGLYTAIKAKEDGNLDLDSIDKYRIGTIFTTGYGPLVSNLAFSESVINGDPDLCSPILFANTVYNSCIGQICINLGCKGVSTIVMGSNNIGYSKRLIEKDKADYIITGSVEEYCNDLYKAFKDNNQTSNVTIKEGSLAFILQKEELLEDDSNAYCYVNSFNECDMGGYPLIKVVDRGEAKRLISKSLRECANKDDGNIDAIFTSNNSSYFDEVEEAAVEEAMEGILNVKNVKKYVGETLGSSFNMNIMMAALCLKNNCIPKALTDGKVDITNINNIMVTGYDVSGNYICMNLSR